MDDVESVLEDVDSLLDDLDFEVVVIGLIHLVLFGVGAWVLRRCCCRGGEYAVALELQKPEASREQLQPRKCILSAYVLWFFGGFVGAHHFYLERFGHGFAAIGTLNFCGVGYLADGLLLSRYVECFNCKRVSGSAPLDGSRRALFVRLPVVAVVVLLAPVFLLMKGPAILNGLGVVNLDLSKAQTEIDPYELLGLPRGASMAEAKAAYRKESLRWHPDRNIDCGKRCESKMADIGKAFEFIKRGYNPLPVENTVSALLQEKMKDWVFIFDKFTAESHSANASPPAAKQRPTKGSSSKR